MTSAKIYIYKILKYIDADFFYQPILSIQTCRKYNDNGELFSLRICPKTDIWCREIIHIDERSWNWKHIHLIPLIKFLYLWHFRCWFCRIHEFNTIFQHCRVQPLLFVLILKCCPQLQCIDLCCFQFSNKTNFYQRDQKNSHPCVFHFTSKPIAIVGK